MFTLSWTPAAQAWINRLATTMPSDIMDAFASTVPAAVEEYRRHTQEGAPFFEGDMVRNWKQLPVERLGAFELIAHVKSMDSENADQSVNQGAAPFNVAWGKQDGIGTHLVAIAPLKGPTAGRLRQKLLRWLAQHVNAEYAQLAGLGSAEAVDKEARALGLPRFIKVGSPATHWAWDQQLADLLAGGAARRLWDAVGKEWVR